MTGSDAESTSGTERFYFPGFALDGPCPNCGNNETMHVGETLIDEKCCGCGIIIGGGYLVD